MLEGSRSAVPARGGLQTSGCEDREVVQEAGEWAQPGGANNENEERLDVSWSIQSPITTYHRRSS